jgi:hypothetical protein
LHSTGHGRLREVQLASSRADGTGVRDSHEGPNIFDVRVQHTEYDQYSLAACNAQVYV